MGTVDVKIFPSEAKFSRKKLGCKKIFLLSPSNLRDVTHLSTLWTLPYKWAVFSFLPFCLNLLDLALLISVKIGIINVQESICPMDIIFDCLEHQTGRTQAPAC